ncbi:DUF58 domain-containing protein [Empedobacter brevis]|uniref:DUF58 domain-containing protein n=2 Tax=Empedobacter brevis TaxID=247 RepID=A0A511NK98_9FLAO|nr:DUF58 domain-containing protein [Empedobacter brevis]MDM1073406.1 DUF58 domain-containing protein [Empedobacter brevis]QHC83818.1 hypothetical protein AS589_02925 [Empedobacter brevis]GEM53232.1 hypothetical protein EB1_30220 [Empedobacter brevis NBRC 14943 = ATCC 43319]
MDAKEIIKRVKRIELKSKRKASNLFMGEYQSSFKGRGMIFSEIRPYQYGDDVRNIDWNKTARYNEPYVKVFEEERELTMYLLVDVSNSENFGTRKQIKMETIAELSATLAFSATTYNDKVGLILYSDQIEKFIPPKKGKQHVLRMVREIVSYEPKSKKTDLAATLETFMNLARRKSNVFILSDFIDSSDYEKVLRIVAKKHDVTAIRVYDEKEQSFPDIGLVHVQDNETGEIRLIDTSSKKLRQQYARYYYDLDQRYQSIFKKNNSGALSIRTDEDYVRPLLNYFKSHKA